MRSNSTPKPREHREATDTPIPYRVTGLDDQPIPFALACPTSAHPNAGRKVGS